MNLSPLLAMLCIFGSFADCHGSRILLFSGDMPSHYRYFNAVGKELLKRNHEVFMLLPSFNDTVPGVKGVDAKFRILPFRRTDNVNTDDIAKNIIGLFQETSFRNMIKAMPIMSKFILQTCRDALSDEVLNEKLKTLKFDLAIIDGLTFLRCHLVLPYKIGIPYALLTTTFEPWQLRIPAMPSVTPLVFTAFSEDMSFWQRVINTLAFVASHNFISRGFTCIDDSLVSEFVPFREYKTLDQLFQESQLWLVNSDQLLEYVRPMTPSVVEVGGLTTHPPKALPKDLEQLVASVKDGMVVVSFGSMIKALPLNITKKFIAAFSHIKQLVVWRYDGEPLTGIQVPANVKLMKWLPQNDLLGHPNTKLFITHCGNNGQFEALFNGIPMIGFPLTGDQPANARRMHYKQYGIAMDLFNFGPEDLVRNIKTLLDNQTYSQNIKKASQIFQSRLQTPGQRAAFWVEHVIQFGGKHLRPHGFNMNLFQFFLLDVLLFFVVIVVIFVFVSKKIFGAILRYCCRSSASQQSKEKKH